MSSTCSPHQAEMCRCVASNLSNAELAGSNVHKRESCIVLLSLEANIAFLFIEERNNNL